jgi:hypothetical protein
MEHQNAIITRFGITSQSLPREYIAEKFSNTCLYESEDMLIDHNIDVLKDNTCSTPLMESDMPRIDRGSKEALNLRYTGARSAARPEHPDLYIANTTPDERGCQTEPNMYGYKKGLQYRISKYTDLVSDKISDMTLSSGVWEPPAVIKAQLGMRETIKKRLNWFDRSRTTDSRSYNSTQSKNSKTKLASLEEADGTNNVLSDIPSSVFTPSEVVFGKNRKLSIIGRREVPTHRFTVAKYGNAPKSFRYKYDSRNKILAADPTIEFEKSEERTLSKLALIMSNESSTSEYTTAFKSSSERLGGRAQGQHGDQRRALDNSINSQHIIEKLMIEQEAKKQIYRDERDAGKRRSHQYYDQEIYDDAKTNKHISIKYISDPYEMSKVGRYSLTELDTDKSMVTAIYSASKIPTPYEMASHREAGIVEYDNNDSLSISHNSAPVPYSGISDSVNKMKNVDETKFYESPITNRNMGPMGKKSKIRRGNLYEHRDTLSDIYSNH